MMFTGIVSELGTVRSVTQGDAKKVLTFEAPMTATDTTTGDSVSVNGVCLTATRVAPPCFTVEVVEESLDRSTLGMLIIGDTVNLERPMLASGRFDGHIVQGHVDGVGTVVTIRREGDAARYRIAVPGDLSRYLVEKGSIALDGTSLTITAVSQVEAPDTWFDVVLIPHTLTSTVLGGATEGMAVNLEVDVLAKYVERMVGGNR
jgi:riboflavin synthase